MTAQYLLVASIALLLLTGGALFLYIASNRGPATNGLSTLRRVGRDLHYEGDLEEEQDSFDDELPSGNLSQKKKKPRLTKEPTIEEKLFMAGRLAAADRRDFHQRRMLAPIVLGVAGLGLGGFGGGTNMVLLGGLLGVIAGLYIPLKMLDSWVRQQHEDISYYLPLVIEQIAIGVSSSLDIGPCLSQIVQMADERKSHNPVTELLKYGQYYIKSGVGLEEALSEIGQTSGHSELKHVFLALSQVSKFGGEISKQLQDLADAVANQREAKIETRIRQLELKATGPVALVFVSFMVIMFLGIGADILENY
jgi:Flp pilus assembly protein TadB